MKRLIIRGITPLLCGALVCIATLIPTAKADEWNKKTVVTVNEPVQVPGTVLDPGTYIFQLVDSEASRHIVQIWTGDGLNLITTVMAVPAYRTEPTGNTVITFDERPSGQPEAIRQWFYPGDNTGQEFVYNYQYTPTPQGESYSSPQQ